MNSPAAASTGPGLSTRERWCLVLGAVFTVGVTYLTPPTMLEGLDYTRLHVLYKEYVATSVRAGRLPLWNPHVSLGRPFVGDIETAFFYPPNLVYLVLGPGAGLVVLAFLH